MIQTSDCLRFAPKAHECLARTHLVCEDTLYRDDPTGVLLSRAINYSHPTAPDFFQNFIMTEAPLFVRHVRFSEDTFEHFA